METNDRISSGVTVIGAEAPSAYHMAPRPSENPNQFLGSSLPPIDAPMPSGESSGKKKRGRPRKYEANGTPLPSSSAPLVKKQRGRGKLNGFYLKMDKSMGFHSSGNSSNF